ncbi:hypothetical protein GXW83_01000 [Streptacidiphilus sp. PB12-B1b]|uniref:hypothetical protein n=1 Tax=Streptacidiphilus sp. PB12-B1b TaxID=2705012 RepID=UPI0015F99A7E|nr:hypothetical protein [Streptacidiphilus sp. PB12-B1b]QMU74573.1 hypothetical protein GXW83_01000 [Streptacidiphilus sp. PB12-B1b]
MAIDALHRWIMVLDVEGFSTRLDPPQGMLREEMYRVLDESQAEAGLAAGDLDVEDRGDGALLVARPDLPPRLLAGRFVRALHDVLLERSQGTDSGYGLRLRLSMHQGLASPDPRGWSGDAVNMAFRLVDCEPLRTALRSAVGSPLVFAVSDTVFHDVIRHGYRSIDPAGYLPADIEIKHGVRTRAWITVPGLPAPPGLGRTTARAGAAQGESPAPGRDRDPRAVSEPASASAPRTQGFARSTVFHIGTVEGDAVGGDKYVGLEPPRRGDR